MYEALITARLAKVSLKSIDIGTRFTFLSRAAWLLFDQGKRHITDSEWQRLGMEYFGEYKIRVESTALLQSLLSAGLLVQDDQGYRFTYGYGYCYFVAKYFQENLADLDENTGRPELYKRLRDLSERVYKQDNASIVIFYVFLTKDRTLINHVLENARVIFGEFKEFDFEGDVSFVNKIIRPLSQVQLPASTPQENRDTYAKRRDEAGDQIEPRSDPSAAVDIVYGAELPFEQKIVIAIRYLVLMGQVLRNFPGSLKADTKLELAFESYALGLRTLGAIFSLAERDADALTRDISEILRTKMAFRGTERQLQVRAELIVAEMLRDVAYAILKRTSHAIGLKELDVTYEEVSEIRDHSLASRLIHLSIRLDHFDFFPKTEVGKLAEELVKNTFSYQTLRDLVLNHLYLFPTDYTIQQWAANLLSFRVNTPQIRGSSRKMLKS